MIRLKSAKGFEITLTPPIAQLLEKQEIRTVRDFLSTATSNLSKIFGVPDAVIGEQKEKLVKFHRPQRLVLNDYQTRNTIYKTGIEELDKILEVDPFFAGAIWEICGMTDVGKTQFCHTVALNFSVMNEGAPLYIDTKGDFSGGLIRKFISNRKLTSFECGCLMQKIKVERAFTAEEIINILDELISRLEENQSSLPANPIKLIIIDSLPAIWLRFSRESERLAGRYLLAALGNRIQRLATKHNIAFLLVNLAKVAEQTFPNDESIGIEEDGDEYVTASQDQPSKVEICLGQYWSTIVRIRLSIEWPEDKTATSADAVRRINVLKSCYTCTGDICFVRLTDRGVM